MERSFQQVIFVDYWETKERGNLASERSLAAGWQSGHNDYACALRHSRIVRLHVIRSLRRLDWPLPPPFVPDYRDGGTPRSHRRERYGAPTSTLEPAVCASPRGMPQSSRWPWRPFAFSRIGCGVLPRQGSPHVSIGSRAAGAPESSAPFWARWCKWDSQQF
jgi:hypothetical protein